MNESQRAGRGSIFLGIAAAAFATGPCLAALIGIANMLDADDAGRLLRELGKIPRVAVFASLVCLIGSVPAACLNAYALNLAARDEYDSVWVAILSGGVIGILVLLVLIEVMSDAFPALGLEFVLTILLFALTGGCMGTLHWAIAIRPRRRWRRRLMRDEEAIRAME